MARPLPVITLTIPDLPLIRAFGNYMLPHFQSFKAAEADFLLRVRKGAAIYPPELISEGEGGAYLMRDDEGDSVAVFKPMFEEPFSTSNPKNSGSGAEVELKTGFRSGEPAIREVAAYLLDYLDFAGVPMTLMVNIEGKVGSLQAYQEHDYESWDLGPSKFEKQQIHKIALLDLRLFNVDRHGGNILVKDMPNGKNKLIPIDHGFSLPDTLATDVWFEWYNWPQAKMPFDRATKIYISKLDVVKDADTLKRLGIRKECVRTMIISSLVVKKGVTGGLNLYQIASLFMTQISGRRRQKIQPSVVSKLSDIIPSFDDEHFWINMATVIDTEISKITLLSKKLTQSFVELPKPIQLPRDDQILRRQLRASA